MFVCAAQRRFALKTATSHSKYPRDCSRKLLAQIQRATSHTGTCTEPFSCDIGDELSRVGSTGGGGIVDVFGGKILHGTLVMRLLVLPTVLCPWEMFSNWGFSILWLFADCTTTLLWAFWISLKRDQFVMYFIY
uniref:(northern house mosquito) hypothetical protein n=1 Tax=Culex pipiens TaxID=7175 RepID=A0A8D8CP73_CULPI